MQNTISRAAHSFRRSTPDRRQAPQQHDSDALSGRAAEGDSGVAPSVHDSQMSMPPSSSTDTTIQACITLHLSPPHSRACPKPDPIPICLGGMFSIWLCEQTVRCAIASHLAASALGMSPIRPARLACRLRNPLVCPCTGLANSRRVAPSQNRHPEEAWGGGQRRGPAQAPTGARRARGPRQSHCVLASQRHRSGPASAAPALQHLPICPVAQASTCRILHSKTTAMLQGIDTYCTSAC